MGFQARFFPDPMYRVLADAQRGRQFAATPMGGTVAGFLAGGRQNPGPQTRSQHRGLLAGMIGIEPVETGFEEALLPADDRGSTGLQPALNGIERGSLCQHQDEPGAKDVAGRQGARLSDAAEFRTLVAGEGHFAVCRHTNLEAYQLVMVTLRQSTSSMASLNTSAFLGTNPIGRAENYLLAYHTGRIS